MNIEIQKTLAPLLSSMLLLGASTAVLAQNISGYNNKIPDNILTHDKVETRNGTMKFFDGSHNEEKDELV